MELKHILDNHLFIKLNSSLKIIVMQQPLKGGAIQNGAIENQIP